MATENRSTITFEYVLLNTILKMRDAKADGDVERYWVFFKYALQLVVPFLPLESRQRIEDNYQILQEEIAEIMSSRINEKSKASQIAALKEQFADEHEYYILASLSKIGIVKVRDVGEINFTDMSLDEIRKYVTGNKPRIELIKEKKPEEENEEEDEEGE